VSSDDIIDRIKSADVQEGAVVKARWSVRIYGIAAHPSTDQLIVSAGDKEGVGIWNVDSRMTDDDKSDDGVRFVSISTVDRCSSTTVDFQW
jgi:hypothetical protein